MICHFVGHFGVQNLRTFTVYEIFFYFTDGNFFIPSLWNGSYVCADNNINITYLLNVSKAENNIGTVGRLMIDSYSLGMTGTFASFAKILALQHQDVVGSEIYGANFSGFEINMQYYSSLYMKGAVVLQTDNGQKSCDSELRRIAGMYVSLNQDLYIASGTSSILKGSCQFLAKEYDNTG